MIKFSIPTMTGDEEKYIMEVFHHKTSSTEGSFINRCNAWFEEKTGTPRALLTGSCTHALELAALLFNIETGDEVIMPTFTIISCAAAVVRAGAKCVLIDSDPATWNMDVSQIEAKITPQTRAIMAVHTYGLPVDMNPVLELAKKHNLNIIEDAAEAHGLTCRGKPCGSFGDLSIFSFYPNKLITTGEGGMVVTDDEALAEKCQSLRNLCFQRERRFVHEQLGWNFRMTNLQAAVGKAQLEQMDRFIEQKRRMGRRYTELLAGTAGLQLPLKQTEYAENIYWVYGLMLGDEIPFDAAEAMRRLGEYKIGTRPFFWPMHDQPVFQKMGLFASERYPIAEKLAKRGFYVPGGLSLTDDQIDHVAKCLKTILK